MTVAPSPARTSLSEKGDLFVSVTLTSLTVSELSRARLRIVGT